MTHNYREQYKDYESDLAKKMEDMFNTCGNSLPVNAEYLANYAHRYLQNEIFIFFVHYVKELAEKCEKGLYDGRNEYACKLAKELKPIIDNFTY